MERIPISGPWITQKEIDYVTEAVTHAWYANANHFNDRFEKAFSDYLGVRFSITVPSCTSAIHLSLLALGIGPGDEVIVPDVTWIASAAPITYVGSTPVFADIDAKTWCLSARAFEACITQKTKCVIPVNLYGNIPEMEKILEIARMHGISVIEDAAESIGSEYRGKKAGGFGDTGVFSFHGSKTLTTGEGGMLVTDHKDVYERVMFLRDHGRKPGDKLFWNTEVAYKYKMSSLQAALGLAQLERIEELVYRKREIFSWYKRELRDLDVITLNKEAPHTKSTYWMVTMILDSELDIQRDHFMTMMGEKGIDCRPFFHPLSSIPAYESSKQSQWARHRNRVSYAISPYGINLPSGFNMTEAKTRHVCDVIKDILKGA